MKSLHDIVLGPEGPFLAAVTSAPPEAPEARERYRAWLAAEGDERAELFDIESLLLRDDEVAREPAIARAKEILAKSASTRKWWSLVSRTGPIRNCGSGPADARPVRFAYECPRTWEDLSPTADSSSRHCSTCARLVYLCRSRDEAEERARRGECVTITTRSFDAITREMTSGYTGRPDPIAIWADRVFPGERTDE